MRRRGRPLCVLLAACTLSASGAAGQTTAGASVSPHESLSDAWWTGPLLTPSAGTLPAGHLLVEPYVYDVAAAGSNGFGSRSYLIYGLVNRLSVGLIPIFGYNQVSDGASSTRPGLGDLTLLGQFRLTQFREGSWVPTTSVVVQEALPTGRYDQLGNRPSDGLGAGAYTTVVALYSQTYFWLPNGRILRMRLNVSQSVSSAANVSGVSVYGTASTFHGTAHPGGTSTVDASWEYSLRRSWVLALDAVYDATASTRVGGSEAAAVADSGGGLSPIRFASGSSAAVALAPAVEYSWRSSVGVVLGVRVIPPGRNTPHSVTPAVAINIVR